MHNEISDGITAPMFSADALRGAARALIGHHRDGHPLDQETEARILEILEDVAYNKNWVIYVP